MMAAVVVASGLSAFAGVAGAAPVPTSAVVGCVNGDGVMSLTLFNPAADAGADFVVTDPQTFVASVIDLAPGASQLVTLGGLPDGLVVVPVTVNGTDASGTSQISCDPPVCNQGVLSTVTDQSGVQHQACVASAGEAPVAPARASLAPLAARTTSSTTQSALPATGAGTGGLVIAAVLVGSGSVVSLLTRRKRVGGRKGFRRRRLTS
jgi:LPXTG-motif cell wall-anchored protein